MAVNIVELLKQMQRDLADQKEYMRNLHIINRNLNEKLNVMEERTTDFPKILVTIERLEEDVKKNNMVLFGNNETDVIFGGTAMPYKPDLNDKKKPLLLGDKSEESIEITEVTELLDPSKAVLEEENESEYEEKIKEKDHFKKAAHITDELKEITSKEVEETKQPIKDVVAFRCMSTGQNSACSQCKLNAAEMSSTSSKSDEISKIDEKLNKITDLYQSDMKHLKDSIKHFEAIIKTFIKETASSVRKQEIIQTSPTYFSTEQINQINDELKRVTDNNQSETREIKTLIEDFIAFSKKNNEEAKNVVCQEKTDKLFNICTDLKLIAETNKSEMIQIKEYIKFFVANKLPVEARTACEQKTVQISPTYFSPDQISNLNSELKRIAEIYQGTNMFPIIEVKPGAADEHPVMKLLRQGVFYDKHGLYHYGEGCFKVKLGTNGLKRSSVIDMITDYPNLTVNDVVKEWLVSNKKWNEWCKEFSLDFPGIYDYSLEKIVYLKVGE